MLSSKDQTHLPYPNFNVRRSRSPDTTLCTQRPTHSRAQYSENDTSESPQHLRNIFPFMFLAGELRNPIYAESLGSRSITLLLLSKRTYAEAKPILYKVGVLKIGKEGMYFGKKSNFWPARIEKISPVPSEKDLPLVQNVIIDIDHSLLYRTFLDNITLFRDSWAPRGRAKPSHLRERGIMAPFMNTASVAPRDTCQIILRNFDQMNRGKISMSLVLHALKYFDNFKNVTLKIIASQVRDGWLDRAQEYCIEELHGNLGVATWHSEDETLKDINRSDGYLMFHPREKIDIGIDTS